MLEFFAVSRLTSKATEITKEKALETVLCSYRDNDMTRDMLTIPNKILCGYSVIVVKDAEEEFVLPEDTDEYNKLPEEYSYNDDGMRI